MSLITYDIQVYNIIVNHKKFHSLIEIILERPTLFEICFQRTEYK